MKVLILALNYSPEPVGAAVYTSGMAEALASSGDAVRVVAAKPFYPHWRVAREAPTRGVENGVLVQRVPLYVPQRPTGMRRIVHQLSFVISALFPMLWLALFWRPQVVIAVAPSLLAAPLARFAASICGARTWLHVQDFEVEAAFATGQLRAEGPVGKLARQFERGVLRRVDAVSSISPQMCRKLHAKGVVADRVHSVRNWADLDLIHPLERASAYRDEWQIRTRHVALYSGSLAGKQGMDIVLAAAEILKARADMTFVICGDGLQRERLASEAVGRPNLQIHPLQPRERLGELLGLASVHILPQIGGISDLVLPSKLGNMLASGRPVVATAEKGSALHDAVVSCGILVPPGNAAALAEAITSLLDDEPERNRAGAAARRRAEEQWNREKILGAFIAELHSQTARPAKTNEMALTK